MGVIEAAAAADDAAEPKAPWHFKLLIIAAVLYLTYRGVQGVVWLTGRF